MPVPLDVSTSLKPLAETPGFDLLPNDPRLQRVPRGPRPIRLRALRGNSLFLAAAITLTNLFLGSLGGYAFARLRFPGREVLFMLVLATLMIPDQLRLVPVFVMLTPAGGPRQHRSRATS